MTRRDLRITGAVISPYQLEFNCFSSELASALEGLYKSPHGLLVKALMVDTAPVEARAAAPQPAAPPPPRITNAPPNYPRKPLPPPPGTLLTNVLNERVLKILLRIEVVKPPPPGSK
jgi:hypothetical protein